MRGRRWQQSSSADAAVSVEISGSMTMIPADVVTAHAVYSVWPR